MRRGFFLSAAGALVVSAYANGSAKRSELGIGVVRASSGRDPFDYGARDARELAWIYGRGLTRVIGGRVVPDLAADVGVDPSFRRYSYRLRHDVRWHDGRPLRPEDVRSAVGRLFEASPAWKLTYPYKNIDHVAVNGSHCTVFLQSPDRAFASRFFCAYGPDPMPLVRFEKKRAIGTSDFQMIGYDEDSYRFELTRGHRRLLVRTFPKSGSAVVALEAGEVDAVVPVDRAAAYSAKLATVGRRTGVVFFVANATGKLNAAKRHALLHAIDTENIARVVYRTGSTNEFLPGAVVVNRGVSSELPREVTIAIGDVEVHEEIALLVAQQLEDLGTKVTIRKIAIDDYVAAFQQGAFDLSIYGVELADPIDGMGIFSCFNDRPGPANITGICDATLQRALGNGDRKTFAHRLSDDAIVRVIAPYFELAAISNRVKLPLPRQSFVPWFIDLASWSIS